VIYIAGAKPKKGIDIKEAKGLLKDLEFGGEVMLCAENVNELRVFASSLLQRIAKDPIFFDRRYIHKSDEIELYYNITRTR